MRDRGRSPSRKFYLRFLPSLAVTSPRVAFVAQAGGLPWPTTRILDSDDDTQTTKYSKKTRQPFGKPLLEWALSTGWISVR